MPGVAARRAWRAYIRVVSIIERLARDPASTRGEAIELALQALSEDPANPIVNAMASDVALHIEGRALKAYELARTSVEQDAYSPFTHASLAQALASLGEAERAHAEALRALRLSVGQPNPSWWHMRCCITAIRSGRLEDAARYAQAARELAPTFKPPLRCLAALRYHLGDEQAAAEALQELKRLEPDFSLEMMGSDDYPVASLRAASLLGIVRSGLL
jgi:predicted Zn-dependent protease